MARRMTKFEFRRALARLSWTQVAAAIELGYSIRTCHGWANGAEIPLVVQKFLRGLINCGVDPENPCFNTPVKIVKTSHHGSRRSEAYESKADSLRELSDGARHRLPETAGPV